MAGFGRVQAALYDVVNRGAERGVLGRERPRLLAKAEGATLEIGAGTGANIEHYRTPTSVMLTEPEPAMAARLERKLSSAQVPVEVRAASALELPFPDASFDTVVSTLVLCSVPDPVRALAEVRRVLRPGGSFLYIEHGGAEDAKLARWQHRLEPVWKRIAGGCHLTRNVEDLLPGAGFAVTEQDVLAPPKTGPFKPFRVGVAA